MNDKRGDIHKYYETYCVTSPLPKHAPVLARIDGRTFSKLTKGLNRPFDSWFTICMKETTEALMKASSATVGYTQSDEISLVWTPSEAEMWFGGKVQKLTSTLAACATIHFNHSLRNSPLHRLTEKLPTFDARVWFVPDLITAHDYFVWREIDAMKNSVSMAAREYYSDKELFKVPTARKKEMLREKGIEWEDYPSHYKRGTYFFNVEEERPFTLDELATLPPKHNAHKNPHGTFKRHTIQTVNTSALAKNLFT